MKRTSSRSMCQRNHTKSPRTKIIRSQGRQKTKKKGHDSSSLVCRVNPGHENRKRGGTLQTKGFLSKATGVEWCVVGLSQLPAWWSAVCQLPVARGSQEHVKARPSDLAAPLTEAGPSVCRNTFILSSPLQSAPF